MVKEITPGKPQDDAGTVVAGVWLPHGARSECSLFLRSFDSTEQRATYLEKVVVQWAMRCAEDAAADSLSNDSLACVMWWINYIN